MICVRIHTIPTNLRIDPELPEKAFAVRDEKTKKAIVTRALQECIARWAQKRLRGLWGSLDWDADFDHKRERARE